MAGSSPHAVLPSAPAKGGRPRSAARLALALAAAEAPDCARNLALRSGIPLQQAFFTVKNMTRAGDLVPVGRLQVPWHAAAVLVYAVGGGHTQRLQREPKKPSSALDLQNLLTSTWGRAE